MAAFSAPPTAPTGHRLSRDQLVASSSGWLAVSLNLGSQGVGYIYQRRWGAFWIGAAAALVSAVVLGAGAAALSSRMPAEARGRGGIDTMDLTVPVTAMGAYVGVIAVGVGSAVEAGLAVKRARRRLGR
jgi:hypothetical protein